MRVEPVEFFSGGHRLKGVLEMPEGDAPVPGIVLCAGYGGIKERILPDISRKLVKAGYAVLRFDYRGFGESEGPRGRLFPLEQVGDIRNALTYLGPDGTGRRDPARLVRNKLRWRQRRVHRWGRPAGQLHGVAGRAPKDRK